MIPGLFDGRDKAFYFFNYEEFRPPQHDHAGCARCSSTRASSGVFRYTREAARMQEVNLLELAAQQRPDGDARSDRRQTARRHSRSNVAPAASPTSPIRGCSATRSRCRSTIAESLPDVPPRLEPHRQPPADGVVELQQDHSEPDTEQPRSATSRASRSPGARSPIATRGPRAALDA